MMNVWRIALIGVVIAGLNQTASGQQDVNDHGNNTIAQPPAATQASGSTVTAGTPTDEEARNSTGGNVAELQQLLHSARLTELRTSYNGSYGASLLFLDQEMTYYVTLFQQKSFWRVIKTMDSERAEAVYAYFVRQTVQLSEVEIRRTKVSAQKAFTERMIALTRDRERQLETDLGIAQEQQAIALQRQDQLREQAKSLDAEKRSSQRQLGELQRRISELQQKNEAGLPQLNVR